MEDSLIRWDMIVVGSGCTGAMAAQTLVERGFKVLMIDGGLKDEIYQSLLPDKDFLTARKTDKQQHRYFLGDKFEGIPFGHVKAGEHLTPPRKFMTQLTQQKIPLQSSTFSPIESLAYGGLGNGWGLGCCVFSEAELKACGLPVAEMNEAYEVVGKRIGVSGAKDDAANYTAARLDSLQPSIGLDSVGKNLLDNYQQKKTTLNRKGFYMGRPSLALITEAVDDRKPYPYKDFDFYSDKDKSAYRPWITVDKLKTQANFAYDSGWVVESFEETPDGVIVHARKISDASTQPFMCKKLVLGSGVLGTARIVLRSANALSPKLPLLSNPFSYLACSQPFLLGKDLDPYKIGFAQLSMFLDEDGTNSYVPMGSVYSYRAMLLFHLLKESPLDVKTAHLFLQFMMPSFTIMGLFHPESYSAEKYVQLEKDNTTFSGDKLKVNYVPTAKEDELVKRNEKLFGQALRSLNCFVLRNIAPGHGASIHYGGTLPFSDTNEPFHLLPDGRLCGSKNVYVADGSGFTFLPGKGLTLSLMANAHLVAKQIRLD